MSGLRLETQYEPLIQAIVNFERQPQRVLQSQRRDVDRQKSVLSTLDSRVSSLNTMLKDFADPFSDALRGRIVTGGDKDAYSVTATDDAPPGAHSLNVHRLAQADTRLSKQFSKSGTELRSFFDTNGEQTFGIEVAAPTSADPDARQTINVTVNPDGATDSEILAQIRTAVSDAIGQAVTDETITSKQRPSLSSVNETSDVARLSLRSASTGFGGRFSFSDSPNGLLALLELDSPATASGTGGGQVTNVGTSEETSDLSSSFTLNGLTMYRDTNTVDDALQGLTLNLSKAGTGASNFSVDADTEGTEEQVKKFIETYNSVISYINQQAEINIDTGSRGILAGDDMARGLPSATRGQAASCRDCPIWVSKSSGTERSSSPTRASSKTSSRLTPKPCRRSSAKTKPAWAAGCRPRSRGMSVRMAPFLSVRKSTTAESSVWTIRSRTSTCVWNVGKTACATNMLDSKRPSDNCRASRHRFSRFTPAASIVARSSDLPRAASYSESYLPCYYATSMPAERASSPRCPHPTRKAWGSCSSSAPT